MLFRCLLLAFVLCPFDQHEVNVFITVFSDGNALCGSCETSLTSDRLQQANKAMKQLNSLLESGEPRSYDSAMVGWHRMSYLFYMFRCSVCTK